MKRVLILGRAASGKSTLAARLGQITELSVIELDRLFWRPGLLATPRDRWAVVQRELVEEEGWIMDGDLGPYDVVDVRLRAADTIIFLDFSLVRCAWRDLAIVLARRLLELALGISPPEPSGFHGSDRQPAVGADLYVLRNPRSLERFVAHVAGEFPARASRE